MSVMMRVEHRRSLILHADPGGGITACGYSTTDGRVWTELGHGSMYDVDCKRCRAVLIAAGDLPRDDYNPYASYMTAPAPTADMYRRERIAEGGRGA